MAKEQKRLTFIGSNGKWTVSICGWSYTGAHVNRLAAFENTMLEPEDVSTLVDAVGGIEAARDLIQKRR